MMLPLVVDFGRWPSSDVVTVATVLDDPARPAASPWPTRPDHVARTGRCRRCRRRAEHLTRAGLGSTCDRLVNPDRTHLARRTHSSAHDGPDLLDLLAEGRPAVAPASTT